MTHLPADLLRHLEAIMFRSPVPGERLEAISELTAAYPEHSEAIVEWLAAVGGLGDGRFAAPPPEPPNYRLIAKIGEGGFGEVWRAEQQRPVRREVALKILKLGMDSAAIVQRFAREQDALARMNHDAIARIHDAGLTPTGQPFFALELVDGAPITAWCDRDRLALRERLALFIAVCHGVQHAHQKGLVHRDLKPSNVLVTKLGERAVPKLIDFGIARALEGDGREGGLTETGTMLGTPAYMAPEQARGDLAAIDTRTDVYSLGAILYELLTGLPPHGDQQHEGSDPWQLRQRILDGDTPRPSACRVQRDAQPSTWLRRLRGDLDWIVLKAMAKEPERRYASAAELAADVQRYLQMEPVSAGPPSAVYRIGKILRRYRIQFGAAAAVVATACTGAVVAWQFAVDAGAQARLAQRNEDTAKERAAQLQQIADLQSDQLSRVDPLRMGARLRQSLLESVPAQSRSAAIEAVASVNFTDLGSGLLDDYVLAPVLDVIVARHGAGSVVHDYFLRSIGKAYCALGLHQKAAGPLREYELATQRRHGEQHPKTGRARLDLALNERGLGDYRASLATLDRIVTAPDDPDPESRSFRRELSQLRAELLTRLGEYSAAERIVREWIELDRSAAWVTSEGWLVLLGQILVRMNRPDEARLVVEEAVDLLLEHPDDAPGKLPMLNNAGTIYLELGLLQDAERVFAKCVPIALAWHGEAHPTTIHLRVNHGVVLRRLRRFAEAADELRIAFEQSEHVLGKGHEAHVAARFHLALAYYDLHRYELAEPIFTDVWANDPAEANRIQAASVMATIAAQRGDQARVRQVLQEAIPSAEKHFGSESPSTLELRKRLAMASGDAASAVEQLRIVWSRFRESLPPQDPHVILSQADLAGAQSKAGDHEAAVANFREALALCIGSSLESAIEPLMIRNNLVAALENAGREEEAATEGTSLLAAMRERLAADHPFLFSALRRMAALQHRLGNRAEAEQIYRELLAGRRAAHGTEHPDAVADAGRFGALLVDLGRHAEAIALLRPLLARARELTDGGKDASLAPFWRALATAQLPTAMPDRLAELEGHLLTAHRIASAPPATPKEMRRCAAALSSLYERWHESAPGLGFDRRAAEWATQAGAAAK